ncbi:MAG: hypothetical protein IAF08_15670 [Rhizobacter sp.]|nr:hypothetical protein [Chlorobiales bacterium]
MASQDDLDAQESEREQEQFLKDFQSKVDAASAKNFEPVEGFRLERWSELKLQIFRNEVMYEDVIESLGLTEEAWDDIDGKWMMRIERDTYQDAVTKAMDAQKQQMASQAEAMRGSGDLAPVDGISLEAWAAAQVKLLNGMTVNDVAKELKVEMPVWDRVSAEWMARMSRDTTATIATVYGQAFMGASQGQHAAAGQAAGASMNAGAGAMQSDPVSFERWVEISESQNAAVSQGIDPQTDLEKFGVSLNDWVNINSYWGQKYAVNAMAYMEDYTKFSDKYREKYAAPDANSDIDF